MPLTRPSVTTASKDWRCEIDGRRRASSPADNFIWTGLALGARYVSGQPIFNGPASKARIVLARKG